MKTALLLLCAIPVLAAENKTQWTLSSDALKVSPGSTVTLRLIATTESGWHIYSMTTPKGGGMPTAIGLAADPSIDPVSIYQPKPERKFDSNFGVDVETFAGETVFLIPVSVKKETSADAA